MIKSFSFFVLLLVLAVSAHAAELTDLGDGLSYLRVTSVDDSAKSLTAALRERESLVLDLRYASASVESLEQFRSALSARTGKQPLFILVSPATPPAVADVLKTAPAKIIFLGIKDALPTPQVTVDQPAATDRLAYDALAAGQPLTELVSGKIDKPRYDEAALMKEFADGSTDTTPSTGAAAKSSDPSAVKPTDRVLQRAVHLHRALLALRPR